MSCGNISARAQINRNLGPFTRIFYQFSGRLHAWAAEIVAAALHVPSIMHPGLGGFYYVVIGGVLSYLHTVVCTLLSTVIMYLCKLVNRPARVR